MGWLPNNDTAALDAGLVSGIGKSPGSNAPPWTIVSSLLLINKNICDC